MDLSLDHPARPFCQRRAHCAAPPLRDGRAGERLHLHGRHPVHGDRQRHTLRTLGRGRDRLLRGEPLRPALRHHPHPRRATATRGETAHQRCPRHLPRRTHHHGGHPPERSGPNAAGILRQRRRLRHRSYNGGSDDGGGHRPRGGPNGPRHPQARTLRCGHPPHGRRQSPASICANLQRRQGW